MKKFFVSMVMVSSVFIIAPINASQKSYITSIISKVKGVAHDIVPSCVVMPLSALSGMTIGVGTVLTTAHAIALLENICDKAVTTWFGEPIVYMPVDHTQQWQISPATYGNLFILSAAISGFYIARKMVHHYTVRGIAKSAQTLINNLVKRKLFTIKLDDYNAVQLLSESLEFNSDVVLPLYLIETAYNIETERNNIVAMIKRCHHALAYIDTPSVLSVHLEYCIDTLTALQQVINHNWHFIRYQNATLYDQEMKCLERNKALAAKIMQAKATDKYARAMSSMKYIAAMFTGIYMMNYDGYISKALSKWCLNMWGDDISALHRWVLKVRSRPIEP